MRNEIEELKTEFSNDILKINITNQYLINHKVSIKTLQCEDYLRSFYGDKIIQGLREKTQVEKTAKVIKISKSDIGLNNILKEINNHFEISEFDEKLRKFIK